MNRSAEWVLTGLAALILTAATGKCGDLVIDSFDLPGVLVFTEIGNAESYRVKWASSPSGAWTNSLELIPATGSGSITSSVPISTFPRFYRVFAFLLPDSFGMVPIPAGTNSGDDPDFGAYSLTVNAFSMDQHLVSKGLWDSVRNDDETLNRGYTDLRVGGGQGSNHPVHSVSWFDAVKWLNARSELAERVPVYYTDAEFTEIYRTGEVWEPYVKGSANGFRLPTMDQWEYAARGGLESKRFPWGDRINHDKANYRAWGENYDYDDGPDGGEFHPEGVNNGSMPYTTPCNYFAPNHYELHDMAGNLWEWNNDWHPSHDGFKRLIRGGAWSVGANVSRVGTRGNSEPGDAYHNFGFRAVLLFSEE